MPSQHSLDWVCPKASSMISSRVWMVCWWGLSNVLTYSLLLFSLFDFYPVHKIERIYCWVKWSLACLQLQSELFACHDEPSTFCPCVLTWRVLPSSLYYEHIKLQTISCCCSLAQAATVFWIGHLSDHSTQDPLAGSSRFRSSVEVRSHRILEVRRMFCLTSEQDWLNKGGLRLLEMESWRDLGTCGHRFGRFWELTCQGFPMERDTLAMLSTGCRYLKVSAEGHSCWTLICAYKVCLYYSF